MSANSKIEWCTATWNVTTGCSRVSEGCDRCYAMHFARRFDGEGKGYDGTTRRGKNGTDWTGVVHLHEDRLELPLRWRKPQRVFLDSMSDLFHPAVPFEFVDRVFAVMAFAKQHTFMILTKRPERMAGYLNDPATRERVERAAKPFVEARGTNSDRQMYRSAEASGMRFAVACFWPLSNVWLGTSVENQEAADKRIPHLLETPAAVRFLSCEPLLGPVDLRGKDTQGSALDPYEDDPKIHWVITGGESGLGARPAHPDWFRQIRDDCEAAGVPYFHKQHGEFTPWIPMHGNPENRPIQHVMKDGSAYYPGNYGASLQSMIRVGKKRAGRLLDGVEHSAFPEATK